MEHSQVGKMYELCFSFPKIELHAHLSGCIRATTLLELAEKKGIDLDGYDFYNVNLGTTGSSELIHCSCFRNGVQNIPVDQHAHH